MERSRIHLPGGDLGGEIANEPRPRGLISDATIRRGAVAGAGEVAGYRRLAGAAGEPHVVRDDLTPGRFHDPGMRVLFRFVHVTDFQLADLTSPAAWSSASGSPARRAGR